MFQRIPMAAFVVCLLSFTTDTTSAPSSIFVVTVSPTSHSRSAPANTNIVITFNQPVNPSTIDSVTVKIFGHWSGVPRGQFVVDANNKRVTFTPSRAFNAGELVTVSLSKGIKDLNGQAMTFGYAWTFWIRPLPGSLSLQEIDQIPIRRTGEGHIQSYGAYGGDFDGDGRMDLAIPNEISDDVRLFLNNGTGGYDSLAVFPLPSGNTPSPNEGADFNGDGILDYAVGNAGNDRLTVMIGDGNGGFLSSVSYQAANAVRGVCVLDLDGDGDMDIVTANRTGSNISLFHNNGDGTFAPRINMEANGSQETACVATDANNDGTLDVVVGAYGSNEMIVLLGDGNGGLTFSSKIAAGGKPWMIAAGDVNGDGNVDIVSANSQSNNASVIFGNGQGGIVLDSVYAVGSFPLAIDLGDIDGDGDLDMVTSQYGSGNWSVMENLGDGTFGNRRVLPASTAGSCATLYDRDNDGDLDMTGIDEIDDLVFLFLNGPPVTVEGESGLPASFSLLQNYPNPFNPATTIGFQIVDYGIVSLRIYDVLGREVAKLVDGELEPGIYEVTWDATSYGSAANASGVYFYRLQAATMVQTRKLVLLR